MASSKWLRECLVLVMKELRCRKFSFWPANLLHHYQGGRRFREPIESKQFLDQKTSHFGAGSKETETKKKLSGVTNAASAGIETIEPLQQSGCERSNRRKRRQIKRKLTRYRPVVLWRAKQKLERL